MRTPTGSGVRGPRRPLPAATGQVPAGAADTGVVVEDDSQAGGVALGGGLALAAAAGAAVVARRRTVRA
ncbi:hypothetical protein KTU01_23240 [Kocuria turfanensis]|uniref:Uncharacterized protein n=1 Tax=Kocuria turfanensis TaxID=388357 RepID=A0A512IEU1_9MICC|nr:hypothetical protein KTU01_23240 [Kocuria turfanensis]